MKDYSCGTHKQRRDRVYPKRKPSPRRDGIVKSHHGISPCQPSSSSARSPNSLKVDIQRKRQAQLRAYRREGIFIEEEYRGDVCYHMHQMEKHTMGCPVSMDQQPEIRWHMRPCLVDFLVEIHFTFRLRPETLYLTLNIVDRYVSRRIVFTKHYQLVGCAALWIAAKFEDAKERVPTLQDLVHICNDAYDESAFIQMEGHVLATIQWTLGHPTAESWLRLLCCEAYVEEAKVQHVARFLMEITLFYREFVKFVPSSIALASLMLARYTCDQPCLPADGMHECLEIVELLDERLSQNVAEISETLVKKYSFPYYSKASTHILQWYLTGNRFRRKALLVLPFPNGPSAQSPLPAETIITVSDDYQGISSDNTSAPEVHYSRQIAPHPFDKENIPLKKESPPLLKPQHVTLDEFIGSAHCQDYANPGSRLALHDLNGIQA